MLSKDLWLMVNSDPIFPRPIMTSLSLSSISQILLKSIFIRFNFSETDFFSNGASLGATTSMENSCSVEILACFGFLIASRICFLMCDRA